MNFIEAMELCFNNPPGPGCIVVKRDADFGVYLGGTDLDGNPSYLTISYDLENGDSEGRAFIPRKEDILSNHWYVAKEVPRE